MGLTLAEMKWDESVCSTNFSIDDNRVICTCSSQATIAQGVFIKDVTIVPDTPLPPIVNVIVTSLESAIPHRPFIEITIFQFCIAVLLIFIAMRFDKGDLK